MKSLRGAAMALSSSKYWSHAQGLFLLLTARIQRHSQEYQLHWIISVKLLRLNWVEHKTQTDKLQRTRLRGGIIYETCVTNWSRHFIFHLCWVFFWTILQNKAVKLLLSQQSSSDQTPMTSVWCMRLTCTHSETVFLRYTSRIQTLFPFLFVLSLHH